MDLGLLIFSIFCSSGVLAIIWLALKPKYPIKYYEEKLLRMEMGNYDGAEIYFKNKYQMVTRVELRNEISRLKKINDAVNILFVLLSLIVVCFFYYTYSNQGIDSSSSVLSLFSFLLVLYLIIISVRTIIKNRSK